LSPRPPSASRPELARVLLGEPQQELGLLRGVVGRLATDAADLRTDIADWLAL
jgi:hypothetical protein